MKILLLDNNCGFKSWDNKIQTFKDWFMPEIKIEVTLEKTNFKNIPWIKQVNVEGESYMGINPNWYDLNISLPNVQRGFDLVVLQLPQKDWKEKNVQGVNMPNNYGISEIYMLANENAYYNFKGVMYAGDQWFNILRHETIHAIYRSRGITDNTHKWYLLGNLAEAKKEIAGGFISNSLVLYFRRLITPPKKYKYFNQNEIEGLKPELCELLDEARDIAGIPFVLTSTIRSPKHNKEVGGVEDSEHLDGEGADIRCRNSTEAFSIVSALLSSGCKRIGIGSNFIHAGISNTKPQRVMWNYYK